MPMTNDFVVHLVLDSLVMEYEKLKVSYNVFRDTWSVEELILYVSKRSMD